MTLQQDSSEAGAAGERQGVLTLIPVVAGVRYYVMDGGSPIGTVNKARGRVGFHADESSILYPSPQAAASSLATAPGDDEIEEHFCGSTACDGGCQERAVEQFDRGQM